VVKSDSQDITKKLMQRIVVDYQVPLNCTTEQEQQSFSLIFGKTTFGIPLQRHVVVAFREDPLLLILLALLVVVVGR
jgi:hypothetical protein